MKKTCVAILFFFSLCLMFMNCQKDSPTSPAPGGSTVDTTGGHTSNGYITYSFPNETTRLRSDSAYITIRWFTLQRDTLSYVSIALFRHDTLISTIDASERNDGSYANWYPTGLPTSNGYRIRIQNNTNTALFDFSDSFRISSTYDGTLEVNAPVAGTPAKIDSALEIRWTRTGNIGNYVSIQLYADTTLAASIYSSYYMSTGVNSFIYTWTYLSTAQGSGNLYRIKVTSTSDPGIYAWSGNFSVATQYNGTYSVTEPTAASVWVAGSGAYGVTWSWTGTPGGYVQLELMQGGVSKYLITSSTVNDGSDTIAIPGSLVKGIYQLKVSSTSDPGINALSAPFQVLGPDPSDTTTNGRTNNGYIRYIFPYSRAWLHQDTTYLLRWTPLQQDTNAYVSVWLFRDSMAVLTLTSSMLNRGSLSWYPASLPTSGHYRLRIRSNSDTSKFDFSDSFTIASQYYGALQVTAPASGAVGKIDSTLTIRWTRTGNVGNYVGIRLYKDTALAASITTSYYMSSSATSFSYAWSYLSTTRGSGSDYRIKIYSTSDTGIVAWSDNFTVTSLYNGGYTVTDPVSTTVWTAGTSRNITWTWTGSPGTYVNIALVQAGATLYTLYSSAVNDGLQSVTPPASLSTGNYQVKISSTSDPSLFAMSETFSIAGLPADPEEPDNSRATARAILTDGAAHNRVLTLNDTDWVSFHADSGKTYFILNPSTSVSTRLYLYEGNNASYTTYYTSGSGYTQAYVWTADTTATHYFRITSYSTGGYGSYTFSIGLMDSSKLVIFTSPAADTVVTAGTNLNILFTTDSLLFTYNYVVLSLYENDVLRYTIDTYEFDDGSYTWALPAYLMSGNRYRIKVADYSTPALYGFSPYFTIQGITPDVYEPDNSRGTAKTVLTDGASHSHTLGYNDTDWVSLSAQAGKTYLITCPSTSVSTRLYLYEGNNASYTTYYTSGYGYTQAFTWTADTTATHYFRINSYSAGGYGSYAFSAGLMDSLKLVAFTCPSTDTVVTAGTSVTFRFTTDSLLFSSYVYLYLYEDTTLKATIVSNTYDYGYYAWTVPAAMASSTRYRVKVRDGTSTALYGMSPYFTIQGVTPDSYEPDNISAQARTIGTDGSAQQHTISYGDSDWVFFQCSKDSLYVITATGSPSLYLYLYSPLYSGYVLWDYNLNPQVAFACTASGTYRVKMTQYSTSSAGSYSLTVRGVNRNITPTFIEPTPLTTWSAGSSYQVRWQPDSSLFGPTVSFALYRRNVLLYTIISSAPNSGTYTWNIPSGLASGTGYRIRMGNYSSALIYGFSDSFAISSLVADDAYEPDDSLSMARSVPADGIPQSRTLTLYDRDFAQFTAKRNFLYRITAGPRYPRLDLYSTATQALIASANTSYIDSTATLTWFCATEGDYAVGVLPGSYTGAYQLTITEYDSGQYRIPVALPAAGDSLLRGTAYNIQWQDSLGVGGYVDIFLYNGAGLVQTVATNTANDGISSWVPPVSLVVGDDYYLRIISRVHSNIYGLSGVFKIR